MFVPVVQVRIMDVAVDQRLMTMGVGVRLVRRIAGSVAVLMVRVVHMTVLVRERLMDMAVSVPFGQVNPQAESHEDAG